MARVLLSDLPEVTQKSLEVIMKRFGLVGASCFAILGASFGCSSNTSTSSGALAGRTYVLVHGAWMGAWCWDQVVTGLEAEGATVTAVELPAHGADTATPISGATLDAYVAKVAAVVDAAATPVILVGHSMGGMVVTQEAENEPTKIAELVYIGAYLPADGQTLYDLASTDTGSKLVMTIAVDPQQGIVSVPQDDLVDDFIADGTPAAMADLTSHYRDEPLAPFMTAVHTTPDHWGTVKKAYLYTTEDHAVTYTLQQQMTANVTLDATAVLPTSHSPFLSQPALVVSTLAGL
jgi:pimeloyl-ACP methyl ester carboxylesterase